MNDESINIKAGATKALAFLGSKQFMKHALNLFKLCYALDATYLEK